MDDLFMDYVRKYNAEETLIAIAKQIKYMFDNSKPFYTETAYVNYGRLVQKCGEIYLNVWGFVDLAYYVVKYSNDYRGKTPNKNELMHLFNDYIRKTNMEAKVKTEGRDILTILNGISQKQFWVQTVLESFYDINRNIILLTMCQEQGDKVDIDEPFVERFGFGIKDFIFLTYSIYAIAVINPLIETVKIEESVQKIYPALTKKNINQMIDYYTLDYEEIRNNPLDENILHINPIVETQRGMKICQSIYTMVRKCADGAYWFLRDYYYNSKGKSHQFVIEYGVYFERYMRKLFEFYLKKDTYHRIVENSKVKLADWYFEYRNYIFVIEQKSSLMSYAAKKEYGNDEDLDKYLINFKKAFEQLDSTCNQFEKEFTGKIILKIAIHYEKIYIGSLHRDKIIADIKEKLSNCNNFFLININDFERILNAIGNDDENIEKIIEGYIEIQNKKTSEGKELGFFLEHYNIENKFLETNDIISEWMKPKS